MLKCHIRHRMADREFSDVTQLLEISGISRNAAIKLFHKENIKTMKLGTLLKICDGLDCKLSDLVEYTPEPKKAKEE